MRVEPTRISVLHWGWLLDGELFATSRYVEWAVLMKHTFGFDALRCRISSSASTRSTPNLRGRALPDLLESNLHEDAQASPQAHLDDARGRLVLLRALRPP
ncbi:hypothetical protein ACMHYB_23170 [Sorangium sp. So ce1128]